MSSAILYLAIVAIWAGVLVPRWLHLRSAPPRQVMADLSEDWAADSESEDTQSPGRTPIEWDNSPPPSYELFDPVGLGADSPGLSTGPVQPGDHLDEGSGDEAGPGESVPAAVGGSSADRGAGPAAAPPAPAYAERRTRVLRARRRMLATVVLVAAAASALAVLHVTPLWAVIPPAFMLAGFLVLLREAAHTDALRARQRLLAARAHSPAVAGEEADGPRQGQTPAAAAATHGTAPAPSRAGRFGEASAQVIDISDRLGDQLYDQYTDAAERAVGD